MKIFIVIMFVVISCMGCRTNGDYDKLKEDLYSHSSEGYENTYAEESIKKSTPSLTQKLEITPTETVGMEEMEVEELKDTITVSYPSIEDTDGLTLKFKRFDVDFYETLAETDNPNLIAVVQLEYNYGNTPTLLTDISPYQFRAFYKGSEYDCQMFLSKKDRLITLKVYGITTKSEDYLTDIRDNLQIILYQNGNPHHILNMTGTFNRG